LVSTEKQPEEWIETIECSTDIMADDLHINNDNTSDYQFHNDNDDYSRNPHEIKDEYLFFAGNPDVEVIKGTIHLFNDSASSEFSFKNRVPKKRSKILCVIAVPSWLSLSDFFNFCGKHAKNFEHV